MKDNFSKQAGGYVKYRPGYPQELFDFIFQQTLSCDKAWDCATGNGQAAKMLAKKFKTVYATDISQQQLDRAPALPNVFYSLQAAEKTNFPANHFDCITVAQALHWFSFDAFYAEATRTAKNDCVIAAWTYGRSINPCIDELIDKKLYTEILGSYWDAERKYVDDHYNTIPFPFEEIIAPPFSIVLHWSLADLEGYLNTWSALQKYIAVHQENPVPAFMEELRPLWENEQMPVTFPIQLRIGKIKK